MGPRPVLVTILLLLLTACGATGDTGDTGDGVDGPDAGSPSSSTATTPSGEPAQPLVPDLVGLPLAVAGERLAGLPADFGRPVTVGCEARPRTIVRQRPAAGTTLEPGAMVHVRPAALDLDRFRGPCDPRWTPGGSLPEEDVRLARAFYRFAADPSLGGPFADGEVWAGIAEGPVAVMVTPARRSDLTAWQVETEYAEAVSPFSALDVVAASGGYYDLQDGVVGTCPGGPATAPPGFGRLRAISLTSPEDVTTSCIEWWGVTLFLDEASRIRAVALRLGSP